MKQSLYQIAQVYQAAYDFVFNEVSESESGELTPDLICIMNAVQEDLDDKLQNCAAIVKELEHTAKACSEEAKRLIERARRLGDNRDKLIGYMKSSMESVGLKKSKGDRFDISVVNNPAAVEITDARLLPSEYMEEVVTVKLKKAEISAAMKAGETVPGAEFRQSTRLSIK